MQPGPRVLVIEDDPGVASSLKKELEAAGYEAAMALRGDDGLAAAVQTSFDVVITALKVPGLSGLDLVDQLHAARPKLPIILMTAYGTSDTAIDAARLGAYVHLPFCVERCGYCSFNTAPYTPGGQDRFLAALLREWDLFHAAPWAGDVTLDTLFLGGGTPSLLTVEQMAALLGRIRARFAVDPGAEVTVECNPDDVTRERVAGYRRAGVTRMSLGVQLSLIHI